MADIEPIYCAEQIVIPPELANYLKSYTKEIIRGNPKGTWTNAKIYKWSAEYFKKLKDSGGDSGDKIISQDQITWIWTQLQEKDAEVNEQKKGVLSRDQILEVCGLIGIPDEVPTNIFTLGGFTADEVNYEQFSVLCLTMVGDDVFQTVKCIFEVFDDEQAGSLPTPSFLRLFQYFAEIDSSMAEEEVREFANSLPTERVTLEDFMATALAEKLRERLG